MTLPTNITLPLVNQEISDPQQLSTYLKRLVFALSGTLQQSNSSANGIVVQYDDASGYNFIAGSTAAGTATYANTILQVRRINLMTFVWFDISWTMHTGTGNLLINMPYFSQDLLNNPFSCVIESDNMTFTAGYTYLTGNITPNTNTIGIYQNGSAEPLIALPISASGHLRGSIVYAGQQFN